MKILISCILLQLFALLASSQVVRQPLNPLLSSGTYSQHHTDAFSFTCNQAALANTTLFTAGIYGEQRFMLEDLSWYRAAIAQPTKSGNFGVKATHAGHVNNKETELGLAYGRKLNDKIAIGTQFNYYRQKMPLYGSRNAISIEAGILLKLNEQVQTGFHIYNPNGSAMGKRGEKLPSIITVGVGYETSDQVVITAEVLKVENEKINGKAILSYYFDKKLYAKAAFTSANALWGLGAGVKLEELRLEVQASFHQQLGFTPGISMIFQKKEQKL